MGKSGSDREGRRRQAKGLFELEMALREEGVSVLVYDEEHELFRFPEDGRFAFSQEWANVKVLQERGYFG